MGRASKSDPAKTRKILIAWEKAEFVLQFRAVVPLLAHLWLVPRAGPTARAESSASRRDAIFTSAYT